MNDKKVIDRQEALQALAESKSKEQLFAEAWREAVELIGEGFFMLKKPLHECTDKWEMEPKTDMFRSRLDVLSGGEQVFAKVVSQFYNDQIFQPHDRPSFREVASRLDGKRKSIIVRLIRYYHGW